MFIRSIFLLLAAILFGSSSKGQKFDLVTNLQISIPQGDYNEVNPDIGFGARVNGWYRPSKEMPFAVGLELGLQEKGRTAQYFTGQILGFYEDFKVSASSQVFSMLVATRFYTPRIGRVEPFVDLAAGWNLFYSTVTVERLTYYSDYNNGYSNSTKGRWAMTYGGAPGLDIPLNRSGDLHLELKVSWLLGNYSRYLTNPYIDDDMQVTFEEKQSRTDMLIPQAGVKFRL